MMLLVPAQPSPGAELKPPHMFAVCGIPWCQEIGYLGVEKCTQVHQAAGNTALWSPILARRVVWRGLTMSIGWSQG